MTERASDVRDRRPSSHIERTHEPGYRWPVAVRIAQYLFLSGQLPFDPRTGRVISGYEDLGSDGRSFSSSNRLVDELEGATGAQVWFLYKRIGSILKRLGSSDDRIVIMNGWYTDFRDWPVMNRMRHDFYQPHFPVSTGFGVSGLPLQGARVMYDAIALTDGPASRQPLGSDHQVGSYFPGSKVGSLIFLAGEVAADPTTGAVIRGYADLDAAGKALATGVLGLESREERIRAQAWFIYHRIKQSLEDVGSSLSRVLKQTIYLQDLRDYPAVERLGRSLFADSLPATNVVCVNEYGHADFRLEVEVVATSNRDAGGRVFDESLASFDKAYPALVEGHPLTFISGQLPFDPNSGRIADDPRTSDPSARAASQLAQIYENVALLLEKQGSGLERLVRQVIYVTDPSVKAAVEEVASSSTKDAPPATTILQVRTMVPRGAIVQADFIAAASSEE